MFTKLLVLSCLYQIVFSVNEFSAKEKRCLPQPPSLAKEIDGKWATSVDTFYLPLLSQLDLYRNVAELLRLPYDEIKEDEIYYNGCLKIKWTPPQNPILYGFNEKKVVFPLTPISDGIFKFSVPYTNMEATSYVTLTDNKTFQFIYNCFDDGEATWAVLSSKKTLDKSTAKKIYEHAKSLGFKPKHFSRMRFETCSNKDGKNKDEL